MKVHLFAGSTNKQLTAEISRLMHFPISKSSRTVFLNTEQKITIQSKVEHSICVFVLSCEKPVDSSLMELFLTLDALKRSGAKKCIAVVPYLGYARQDKQHNRGECISLAMIAHFLKEVGCNMLITFNMHSTSSLPLFTIPTYNLDATPALVSAMRQEISIKYGTKIPEIIIVAPDRGAVAQAQFFAQCLDNKNPPTVAIIDKKRDKKTNKPRIVNIEGDFKNKIVIIIDDIISSGDTIFQAAQKVKQLGALHVYGAVVHNELSEGSFKTLSSSFLKKVFVTNTISLTKKHPKLIPCSIAQLVKNELSKYT